MASPRVAAPAVAWPVITFTEGVDFHLNDETIRVVHVKASHTDGDSMVWFVEPNVLHMGDLFFNGIYPGDRSRAPAARCAAISR